MYYIYHIKSIKIGCTNNIQSRVVEQQGYKNYEILYESPCIEDASSKEIELQKEYKYKVDSLSYKELINKKNKKMVHVTQRSVTFKNTESKKMDNYMFPSCIELSEKHIVIVDSRIKDWIIKNNLKSQNNSERFVYVEALKHYDLQINPKNKVEIFNKIRLWAQERGIYDKGDVKTQYIKLQEESGELAKAILNEDEEEIIDALGDIGVVLTNLAHLAGYSIEECIESAYNVIKTRKGKMENGTFIKDS